MAYGHLKDGRVASPGNAVGYVRVRIGGGVALVDDRMVRLQTQRVVRESERRGWALDELFVDRDQPSGPGGPGQPGLVAALEVVGRGRHVALVVAIFDRFTRTDPELMALARQAGTEGWALIVAR